MGSVFDIFLGKWVEETIFDLIGHRFGVVGNLTETFEACFIDHGGVGHDMSSAVQGIEQLEFDTGGLECNQCIDMGVSHEGKNFFGGEVGFDLDVIVFGNGFLQHL